MQSQRRNGRLFKEMDKMQKSPPTGIACWFPNEECTDLLEATILGPEESPYAGGTFKLSIKIPERYPMEPPMVAFLTKIYHPNIDTDGRICLDLLKMPPTGSWKPIQNLSSLLTSIRLLMLEPNPDDPLMTDIATEVITNRMKYEETAKDWTRRYASGKQSC